MKMWTHTQTKNQEYIVLIVLSINLHFIEFYHCYYFFTFGNNMKEYKLYKSKTKEKLTKNLNFTILLP